MKDIFSIAFFSVVLASYVLKDFSMGQQTTFMCKAGVVQSSEDVFILTKNCILLHEKTITSS